MQWHHTGTQSSLGRAWGGQGRGRLPGDISKLTCEGQAEKGE